MKKRFKKGARLELTFGEWLETPTDDDGSPAFLCCGSSRWRLSAEDIRRIQTADLLEDVPEPKTPGQRLEDALRKSGLGIYQLDTGDVLRGRDEDVERVAVDLGIKPEGE